MNRWIGIIGASAVMLITACAPDLPTAVEADRVSETLSPDGRPWSSVAGEVVRRSEYADDGSWTVTESSLTQAAVEIARRVRNESVPGHATAIEFDGVLQRDTGLPPPVEPTYFVGLPAAAYAIALGVYKVWTWNTIIRTCVPPWIEHWILTKSVSAGITSSCLSNAAAQGASKAVSLRLVSASDAARVRTALLTTYKNVITTTKIRRILVNASSLSVTRVVRDMVGLFYDLLVNSVESVLRRFR
jgi:hypothetical protein